MINYLVLLLLMIAVMALLHKLQLVALCKDAMAAVRQANAVIANPQLSDLDKERLTQQNAKRLMGFTLRIFALTAVVLALPMVPVYLLSELGWLQLETLWQLMTSIEVILVMTLIVVFWLVKTNRD